nr:hypothetical protein [Chitinophagaceae bacterium]
KNKIIDAVYQLFGALSNEYISTAETSSILLEHIIQIAPKISRGENYEGLPWVMLDYPRFFTKQEVVAIRTFFWWGNFCSITLQLKGNDVQLMKQTIIQYKNSLNDWWLCCNKEDEWQHHFRANNYKPLEHYSVEEIEQLQWIKLAIKIPLQEWENMNDFFSVHFSALLQLLATQTMK